MLQAEAQGFTGPSLEACSAGDSSHSSATEQTDIHHDKVVLFYTDVAQERLGISTGSPFMPS